VKTVILVTGASSGFGALTARALAKAGHTVYGSMTEIHGHNAPQVEAAKEFSAANSVDLRSVELDVTSQESVDSAVKTIFDSEGRLDVVVHNAGHMTFGPAEAFTPEQLAHLYDINVLGTQRVNRAILPAMRDRGQGLLVWIGSTSTRGGTPPYLGPYFAAKAGMDSLAVTYAGELSRWGIETTIIVPGAFTSGTNHFAHATKPEDTTRAAAYGSGPYKGFGEAVLKGQESLIPADADVAEVAKAIVDVVAMPYGKRPFRVHVDPSRDGAEVVAGVADRVREEFLRRIGLEDILRVHPLSDKN
jgi:NAD(P)-dependent dehydrogenase (short-subunit alcohol dehydrogenase family)